MNLEDIYYVERSRKDGMQFKSEFGIIPKYSILNLLQNQFLINYQQNKMAIKKEKYFEYHH